MKTATLPSIRVEPEFRLAVQSLLGETETMTEFVENSVREAVTRRSNQAAFLARGIKSLETAAQNGSYVDADVVLDKLRQRLETARQKIRSAGQ